MARLLRWSGSTSLGSVIAASLALAGCAAPAPREAAPPIVSPNLAPYPPAPPITVIPLPGPSEPSSQFPPEPAGPSGARNGFAKCASCHSLVPGRNMLGPSLAGIYGRKAGSDPRYRYSAALAGSGLVWDAATLDRFLTRPRDLVPGNKMTFAGLSDPAIRAEIIAYLQRY